MRDWWVVLVLVLAGCNRFGGPMAIKNCAIHPAAAGRSFFVADVQNQRSAAAVSFKIMAARSGRIVIANGENIATYEFTRRLAPGEWAHVESASPSNMLSISDCTVAYVNFADGSYWSMPTPEF